ncbi:ABC transporter permease [Galbitalea sp. SE-J8]|uniref:ABC transporter permease n=1 Tax=Galbitalea sp. SE-J8 TaxID=3054952 RepID=UPI00259D148B|nr:ABC transporter permease [Galbitalea sp. SE-J8]MDM4763485.1 ABC transporter permease [Galbitalea sp. SE-J8]
MAFGAFATTAAQSQAEDAPRRRSWVALVLLLPGIAYLALFFLVPLVSLVLTSFNAPGPSGAMGDYVPGFEWSNYVTVVSMYGEHIIRSFLYALLATAFALLFSYPLAYLLGVRLRRFPLVQALGVTLVIAPFFISFLLRTLAWKAILSDEGPVSTALHALSLLGSDDHITGTPFSVVFGLTYNFIPFMTLPIYTSLERLDLRYVEAGGDLYAGPVQTFLRVTLPLSLPGVVSGSLLTFIPAAGDYVNASSTFLGGTGTQMVGNVIEANFLSLQNYPAAAAMSIILMAIILVLVGVYVARSGTKDLV